MKITNEQYEKLSDFIVKHYDMGSYILLNNESKIIDSSYKIKRNLFILITVQIDEENRKVVITSDEYGRREMGAYRIANYCKVLSFKFLNYLFKEINTDFDKRKLEKLIEDKLPIGELL